MLGARDAGAAGRNALPRRTRRSVAICAAEWNRIGRDLADEDVLCCYIAIHGQLAVIEELRSIRHRTSTRPNAKIDRLTTGDVESVGVLILGSPNREHR